MPLFGGHLNLLDQAARELHETEAKGNQHHLKSFPLKLLKSSSLALSLPLRTTLSITATDKMQTSEQHRYF